MIFSIFGRKTFVEVKSTITTTEKKMLGRIKAIVSKMYRCFCMFLYAFLCMFSFCGVSFAI